MKRRLFGLVLGLAIASSLFGPTQTARAFGGMSPPSIRLYEPSSALALGVDIAVYGGGGALAVGTAGFLAADVGLAVEGSALSEGAAIAQIVVGAVDALVGTILAMVGSDREPLMLALGVIGLVAGGWLIGHGALALSTD